MVAAKFWKTWGKWQSRRSRHTTSVIASFSTSLSATDRRACVPRIHVSMLDERVRRSTISMAAEPLLIKYADKLELGVMMTLGDASEALGLAACASNG